MDYTKEQMAYIQHIQKRMGSVYHAVSLDTWWSIDTEIATFPLWSLSGQLKGLQIYNWRGSKSARNSAESKYWTVAKSGPCFYGAQFFNYDLPYLFICEGVFDCLSLLPFGNAIALLSNDPKPLREQISVLPFKTIAICDDDKAGKKLAKSADDAIICNGGKDPNELTYSELKGMLGQYAIERDFNEEYFKI